MGTPQDGVISSQDVYWKSKNPGLTSGWEWVNNATGSQLIVKLQKLWGVTPADGIIGPGTIRAMQKYYGVPQTGTLTENAPAIRKMQEELRQSTKPNTGSGSGSRKPDASKPKLSKQQEDKRRFDWVRKVLSPLGFGKPLSGIQLGYDKKIPLLPIKTPGLTVDVSMNITTSMQSATEFDDSFAVTFDRKGNLSTATKNSILGFDTAIDASGHGVGKNVSKKIESVALELKGGVISYGIRRLSANQLGVTIALSSEDLAKDASRPVHTTATVEYLFTVHPQPPKVPTGSPEPVTVPVYAPVTEVLGYVIDLVFQILVVAVAVLLVAAAAIVIILGLLLAGGVGVLLA